MRNDEFAALMPFISADLAAMIAQRQRITDKEAIKKLYASKLYETLEDEQTKLWHYSTSMLFSLFEQEERTGTIAYPDV